MTPGLEGALRALLLLFPPDFRREFGADMEEQIRSDFDRASIRGLGPAVWFALATAVDLARAGIAERWSPTWVGSHPASTTGRGGEGLMREWIRDLAQAGRALRRSPGFAAMTIGTLGLAIGANAAIFAVVDAVLIDPLPFANADRLVSIAASAPGSDLPEEFGVSTEFYVEYAKATDVLESVSMFGGFTSSLRVGDRVERVNMANPTYTLFETLGVEPILGRLPVESDEDRVALISHSLWVDWFGADPQVIGRDYSVSGAQRTIIGVMAPEFRFPRDRTVVWFPTAIRPDQITPGRFGAGLIGRVPEGVDLDLVRDRLDAVARRLPELYGGSANYARVLEQHSAVVRPLDEEMLGAVAAPLWILLAAVGIVLLIACANVANLFLVRSEQRQRDVALRRAIGAGRGQLMRAQLAESLLVAAGAGVVAVALAWVGLPVLVRAAPAGLPRVNEVGMSVATLGFTALACVVASIACGLAPALRAGRADADALRDGARGSTRGSRWGRDGLVVAQTALGLVLLVCSGLLVRSFQELRRVDPGYDTKDLMTFQLGVEAEEGLDDGPSFARFHMDFADRIAAMPGVESVGIIENIPLNEGVGSTRFTTRASGSEEDGGVLLGRTWAGADYFATMGLELRRGRAFEDADHSTNLGNVVISQKAADMLWPGGDDPIGQQVQWAALGTWETVVGVVEDVMQYSLRDEVQPLVYFPLVAQNVENWSLTSPAYVVKTTRADVIAPEIRALALEAAPTAPMYRVYTMEQLTSESMVQLSFTMLTIGIAAVLALVLGMVGLYGVLSYVVAQRTREIGVRMALGARAEGVRRMVVVQGARVVVIGVVVGTAIAAAVSRSLGSLLFGVAHLDPVIFAAMALTMVAVGMLASYVPARRASNVDPIVSLRGD